MSDYPPAKRLTDDEIESFAPVHFIKGLAVASGIALLLWVAIICLFVLGGCASNKAFYNPNRSDTEARVDWEGCRYEAQKYGFVPMYGSGIGPGIEQALRQRELMVSCMGIKGYSVVDIDTTEERRLRVTTTVTDLAEASK